MCIYGFYRTAAPFFDFILCFLCLLFYERKYLNFPEWVLKISWHSQMTSQWRHKVGYFSRIPMLLLNMTRFLAVFNSVSIERGRGQRTCCTANEYRPTPLYRFNAMTSDFLLLISHGWVVTFPDSHHTVFTFRNWLDLLDVVLAFRISILKISIRNCLHRVIDITSFEKHLESSLDHTPNFCRNLVIFRSKNMYLTESFIRSSTVI